MLLKRLLVLAFMLCAFGAPPALATQRISLDVHDADVSYVLRHLAEKMGVRLITDSTVKGPVTVKLHDVPTREAFKIVAAVAHLDYDWYGNLIVVGSKESLSHLYDSAGHRLVFSGKPAQMDVKLEHAKASTVADQLVAIWPNLRVSVYADGTNRLHMVGLDDQLRYVYRVIKGVEPPR